MKTKQLYCCHLYHIFMSENEDKVIILLSSLPPFYEHFVDILLYERQSLAMQDVKEALSLKESSKKSKSKDDEGLTARGRFEKWR